MKAKHIFLVVILFFCSVSLNAQNQALDFLKAETHNGDPTIEETVNWLGKNIYLNKITYSIPRDQLKIDSLYISIPCNYYYNGEDYTFNYSALQNTISFEISDIGCGGCCTPMAGAPEFVGSLTIFLDNLSKNIEISTNGLRLPYGIENKKNEFYFLKLKSFVPANKYYEQRELGYVLWGRDYDYCSGRKILPFRELSMVISSKNNILKKQFETAVNYLATKCSVEGVDCRDFGACLNHKTKIKSKNNIFKSIDKLKINDSITSYSVQNKQYFQTTITGIDSVYHNNLVEFHYENDTITCTDDHPFFIENKGWCSLNPEKTMRNYSNYPKVNLLEKGDSFLSSSDNGISTIKLEDIKFLTKGEMTYTITGLKKGNTYFANGILTGVEILENPF